MASKVQGLDRLKKKLAKLPQSVKAEMRVAIATGAEEVVALAKSLCPVDDGDLRDSIGWTWGEPPKGSMTLGRIGDVAAAKAGAGLIATIYAGDSKAFYARFVEFGTAPHINRGRFAGTQHPGTAAQAFFFPAYRAVRKRIRGRVTRAVNKAARRVAAGG